MGIVGALETQTLKTVNPNAQDPETLDKAIRASYHEMDAYYLAYIQLLEKEPKAPGLRSLSCLARRV